MILPIVLSRVFVTDIDRHAEVVELVDTHV